MPVGIEKEREGEREREREREREAEVKKFLKELNSENSKLPENETETLKTHAQTKQLPVRKFVPVLVLEVASRTKLTVFNAQLMLFLPLTLFLNLNNNHFKYQC